MTLLHAGWTCRGRSEREKRKEGEREGEREMDSGPARDQNRGTVTKRFASHVTRIVPAGEFTSARARVYVHPKYIGFFD